MSSMTRKRERHFNIPFVYNGRIRSTVCMCMCRGVIENLEENKVKSHKCLPSSSLTPHSSLPPTHKPTCSWKPATTARAPNMLRNPFRVIAISFMNSHTRSGVGEWKASRRWYATHLSVCVWEGEWMWVLVCQWREKSYEEIWLNDFVSTDILGAGRNDKLRRKWETRKGVYVWVFHYECVNVGVWIWVCGCRCGHVGVS